MAISAVMKRSGRQVYPISPLRNNRNLHPMVRNDPVAQSILFARSGLMDRIIDYKHDIDRECGYPVEFMAYQYRRMYDREGVARVVVRKEPDECWAMDPEIYEIADPNKTTKFEDDLAKYTSSDSKVNLHHYWHRADCQSRIGYYGAMLFGFDDGKDLSEPVDGINEDGEMTWYDEDKNVQTADAPEAKLLWVRSFDQTLLHILQFQQDPASPRFGEPLYYHVRLVDITTGIPESTLVPGNYYRRVHWSRMIHLADNRESGEVYGVPAQRPVLNRLLDLRKTYGGSAEMFWKGGFPGIAFEILPEFASEAIFDETDREKLRLEFENYVSGLQRYLPLKGMTAKPLTSEIAAPDKHIMEQLKNIALTIQCPLRIFLGSEEAKQASVTDKRSWNERMHRRQTHYLTPKMIRPSIHRLIATGCVARPKNMKYTTLWPDLNKPTDQDKANLAVTRTQCIVQYVASGAFTLIPPAQFFNIIMMMPLDEVQMIMEAGNWNKMKAMAAALNPAPASSNGNGKSKSKSGTGGPGKPAQGGASKALDFSSGVSKGMRQAKGGDNI